MLAADRFSVGAGVGEGVGVGIAVGSGVGTAVGIGLGIAVGIGVGIALGAGVGEGVGTDVASAEGDGFGSVGCMALDACLPVAGAAEKSLRWGSASSTRIAADRMINVTVTGFFRIMRLLSGAYACFQYTSPKSGDALQ